MLNIRALPPATQLAQPLDTPASPTAAAHPSVDPGPASRAPTHPSSTEARPLKRALLPTLASAPEVRHPDIAGRLNDMKAYLAELQSAHATGRELSQSRDAQFLDLLAAVENARDPSLRLSAHAVNHAALGKGKVVAMKAVAGLARTAIEGMGQGSWHAVLSVDDHEVALAAKHDPQHPARLSLIAVDSVSSHLLSGQWGQIALLVGEHMNRALAEEGKPADAQVWVNCLNTSTQKTGEGGAIFALGAVRQMPRDADVQQLHEKVLAQQAGYDAPAAARVVADNSLLGARFFKHMTLSVGLDDLLKRRPELEEVPVNKKGQTLRTHQAEHLLKHRPLWGLPHVYSDSYEQKRLKVYERAIQSIETAAAPQLVAKQLQGMEEYVYELRRAFKGKASLPASRDAEFIGLLVGVENTLDPQLRLSAHRVDPGKLAAREPAAIDDLWRSVAEGVRSGAGWHATVDFGGHHAALSARHDPANAALVSLVMVDGAGSPLSPEDLKGLAQLLSRRLQIQLHDAGDSRQGKVWLTHLDVSARQPDSANSALFALLVAKDLKGEAIVGDVHADALAQARSRDEPAIVRGRAAGDLIDPDYGVDGQGNPQTDPQALREQIEMYRSAIGHYERSLA